MVTLVRDGIRNASFTSVSLSTDGRLARLALIASFISIPSRSRTLEAIVTQESSGINREQDALELGFLLQNRDAPLEFRSIDLRDETRREPRDEAIGNPFEVLRRHIAGEHDGPLEQIERVERVKELLLRLIFSRKKLNVVQQEGVAGIAVPLAEFGHRRGLERRDELVDEVFRGDIDDARVRLLFEQPVANRIDEMRLAQARSTAEKQRIEPSASQLR